MSSILVSGLINIETTLRIDGFPLDYFPVRYPFFGINSTVSGVGYNISKALKTLGNEVRLLSIIGKDVAGDFVLQAVAQIEISVDTLIPEINQTAQSVILYDGSGRRQIHTDLKDIQSHHYPPKLFEQALPGCGLAVLCNIGFSRSLLAPAKAAGVPIASDVHAIDDIEDEYNQDFMAAADILFMSDERLPVSPSDWIRMLWERYGTKIAVVGMGSQGAMLGVYEDGAIEQVPAVLTRPVANTIGAGDALFSSFLHYYLKTGDPHAALRKAVLFASYKIGASGAADGFLDEQGVEHWIARAKLL